jgi:hypothetical protein
MALNRLCWVPSPYHFDKIFPENALSFWDLNRQFHSEFPGCMFGREGVPSGETSGIFRRGGILELNVTNQQLERRGRWHVQAMGGEQGSSQTQSWYAWMKSLHSHANWKHRPSSQQCAHWINWNWVTDIINLMCLNDFPYSKHVEWKW